MNYLNCVQYRLHNPANRFEWSQYSIRFTNTFQSCEYRFTPCQAFLLSRDIYECMRRIYISSQRFVANSLIIDQRCALRRSDGGRLPLGEITISLLWRSRFRAWRMSFVTVHLRLSEPLHKALHRRRLGSRLSRSGVGLIFGAPSYVQLLVLS